MASVVTTATLDAVVKDVFPFGSEIFAQINQRTPAKDLIESGNQMKMISKVEGRRLWVPMMTGENANADVAITETGGQVTGGAADFDKAIFNAKIHNTALKMSKLAMVTAKGGEQSVSDMLTHQMTQTMTAAGHKRGWLLHQDGSGMLAQCGVTSSTNVIQLATGSDMTFLKVDTEVVIRDLDDGTLATGQTSGDALVISARNTSNYTITVLNEDGSTPTLSTAATDGVYTFDTQGETVNGVGILCSNSNPTNWGSTTAYLGNRNRTTNTDWRGQVIAAANTGSTTFNVDDHVQPMIDAIDEASPDPNVKLLAFVRYDNWHNIARPLLRDQQTGRMVKLKQGYDGIEYQNVVFVLDRLAPKTAVRFVDVNACYRYVLMDDYWDDTQGSIWRQTNHVVSGRRTQVFLADIIGMQEMVFSRCCTSGQVTGLTANR